MEKTVMMKRRKFQRKQVLWSACWQWLTELNCFCLLFDFGCFFPVVVWFWMLFPCGCLILDAFFLWLFVNFVCFVCFHRFCFCLLLLFWGDVLLFVLAWFGFWHGFTFTGGGMEWQLVIYLLFCLLIVTCMKQEVFVFGLTFSHFQKKWVYSDYRDHWMRSVKLELIDIITCTDLYL